jgi:hypothetical protein
MPVLSPSPNSLRQPQKPGPGRLAPERARHFSHIERVFRGHSGPGLCPADPASGQTAVDGGSLPFFEQCSALHCCSWATSHPRTTLTAGDVVLYLDSCRPREGHGAPGGCDKHARETHYCRCWRELGAAGLHDPDESRPALPVPRSRKLIFKRESGKPAWSDGPHPAR